MDPKPSQTQAFPPSTRGNATKHGAKPNDSESTELGDQGNVKENISILPGTGIAEQLYPSSSADPSSQATKPVDVFKDIYGVSRGPDSPGSDVESQHRPITSPLTHPNGVSMFPELSVTEQEAMSRQAVAQAEDNIVADSDDYSSIGDVGSDAGYGSDSMTTASTSIGSSVRDYMFENGRRYHSFRAGAYNFPNDDIEQEREDMKHAMVRLLSGQKLHFAPIDENLQNVLDIGTGTGIWAIEMGEQYPSANVLGIDLSPIQPTWLPPNVHFMVDDVESPWLHPQNHFDYVHSRHTVQGIKDWPQLFSNALQHIKPGGWMELQEIHHYPHNARTGKAIPPHEHPVAQYWTYINEGLKELGVDFPAASGGKLAAKMQAAGFVNVTERIFHVPLGTWPKNQVLKTVGLYWRTILTDGLQAIALGPMSRGMGWSRDQIEVFLVDVRRAYSDNTALLYMPMHIIYGQRPY
ncbi:methyltransferase [Fusarium beomiforme]|uniref:Methyltransferase n=1 Tax=Fusarium beomiforme TaxID=44412 RepID=A0A9P5ACJ6_9HYPO|nr:methyltransferase [Fusarium beomiforme]